MITFFDMFTMEKEASIASLDRLINQPSSRPMTPGNKPENEQLTIPPLTQSVLKRTTSAPVELFPNTRTPYRFPMRAGGVRCHPPCI